MKGYIKIRKKILGILYAKLPKELSYHNIDHTLDALKVCDEYVKQNNIVSHQAKLLRLGVLFHDIGFTVSINEHEKQGVEIAENMMNEFEFTKKDIEIIKGLILATQTPQLPKNQLEKIICDIDLDYLGRDNFYQRSNLLYQELKHNKGVKDKYAWNKIQITFLESHVYQTDFAKKIRQPIKEKRIDELKKIVRNNERIMN